MTIQKIIVSKDFEDYIPEYLEDIQAKVDLIKTISTSKDFTMINEICHKIKGSAGGFGFDKIGEYVTQIENCISGNDLKAIDDILQKIEDHLGTIEVVYE
ncbi:MAG: Hpt domain-containing protein [Flavobacteriaceae bacterium]|nr:Hpt domain-containing protein [Flavobacteriaceae bacterium]